MIETKRPLDDAVITEPDEIARDLRNQVVQVLGRDDSAWSSAVPNDLAGHCYALSEAYYHAVPEALRGQLTPKQVTIDVVHPVFIGEVSHWFLERSDGAVVDLSAEQFGAMSVDVPYDEARGRGFVPPSPSNESQQLLEAIDA